ncbi:MAG: hypothetical protein ACOYMK_17690 [Hyphomonadaceae bacterium]
MSTAVGANLRVATQRLEAATGEIVWTGKFDRPLTELAELQEELVTDIAGALETRVYSQEIERALKKPGDITAWEAVARSLSAYRKWDTAAHANGIEEARRAVAIAPDYASGHAMLAYALSHAYLGSPDDPAEVQRIRAIAEHAPTLAPDDASVLGFVGRALSIVGYPEEGVRYTGRAVRKAPGSGLMHFYHGVACVLLNRPEEALSHLKTAERLMPGSHLMWGVKVWQSRALQARGRWEQADAALDESLDLYPSLGPHVAYKAYLCLKLGRDAEARKHVETARRLGWDLALTELHWRRLYPISPTLEADIATVRALYAATEPSA